MKRRGQRFVKADYYELDWYYEECTDGKTTVCYSYMHWPVSHSTWVVLLGLSIYFDAGTGSLSIAGYNAQSVTKPDRSSLEAEETLALKKTH